MQWQKLTRERDGELKKGGDKERGGRMNILINVCFSKKEK